MLHYKQKSSSRETISIAPGEGKYPSNLMRNNDWDINAFPHLFPSGKFGMFDKRTKSLSPQQYLIQRLLNVDSRFRDCKPYLFSSLYYLERHQLEKQINISYLRGTVKDGQLSNLEDAFSVFDNVAGTPRYWQKKRFEMISKLEQLGPFQFFFTLSCADKKWAENFSSILALRGKKVEFRKNSDHQFTVYVEGLELEDYLENENLHGLVKENILTVTRIFDNRIHQFLKHIVLGANAPMNVAFYNYRVEFQMRGAGHIHGVLWCDLEVLDKTFQGLKVILKKFQNNEKLSPVETDKLAIFIDSFVSCSLETDVKDIVSEVQIHSHTKTCRKQGNRCRFGYPRFPSKKTIIAQPLDCNNFDSLELYNIAVEKHLTIISKVRQVLENLPENIGDINLLKLLELSKVSEEDYYSALSVTKQGTVVILKRTMQEIFVNNYNIEWIRAWNANMDIQPCLDFFAIVTYITDYYSKDESGLTDTLLEGVKKFDGRDMKSKMQYLAQAFLTHRQIGESEAIYRILPNLHLSESNIKTVFVASGFPHNRSKFLVQLPEKKHIRE